MEKVCERVVELLGKSQDDPCFSSLVVAVGETPRLLLDSEITADYMFEDSGLNLAYMKEVGCFVDAWFRSREYRGDLPAGIDWADEPAEVQLKLGLKPVSSILVSDQPDAQSKTLQEEYVRQPIRFWLCFSGGRQKLSLLKLTYIPAYSILMEKSRMLIEARSFDELPEIEVEANRAEWLRQREIN